MSDIYSTALGTLMAVIAAVCFMQILVSSNNREKMERCTQFFSEEFSGYDHANFVCSYIIYAPSNVD